MKKFKLAIVTLASIILLSRTFMKTLSVILLVMLAITAGGSYVQYGPIPAVGWIFATFLFAANARYRGRL